MIVTSDKEVKKTIEDNKWNLLCEHPDPIVVPIVREFYANGMECDEYKYLSKANESFLIGPLSIIITGWIMWMMRSTIPFLTVMTLIRMPSEMSCAE